MCHLRNRIFSSSTRRRLFSRVSIVLLLYTVVFSCCSEFVLSAVVTLGSIEIFQTHEWVPSKPTVYFQCRGENKTFLPDVKETHVVYSFKGEESWQPLTEFFNSKCMRCGFYEKDTLKSDDMFDEWEFCPSDFEAPDGNYMRFKDKEYNATFFCQECLPLATHTSNASGSKDVNKGMHWVIVVVISVVASTLFIAGLVAGYKFWLKRKRQQEQARFLKLFEDGDDMEDELGISPLGSVV